jgi:hypothetical protein
LLGADDEITVRALGLEDVDPKPPSQIDTQGSISLPPAGRLRAVGRPGIVERDHPLGGDAQGDERGARRAGLAPASVPARARRRHLPSTARSRDLFDRAPIAHPMVEGPALVTINSEIRRYACALPGDPVRPSGWGSPHSVLRAAPQS